MTPLKMPMRRLSEEEMREIVVGRLACDLMFSGEISPSVRDMCMLPVGMGILAPPPQLVEALLGSAEPPETLEGDPPKPTHPGYPPGAGEPPPKPVLGAVPEKLLNALEWGDVEEEEVAEARAAVEKDNRRRINEWTEATWRWQEAIDNDSRDRATIDAAHEQALEEWRASLPDHEAAKTARQEAHDEWKARYDEAFSEWLADLGEIMGRMKDAFPRGVNGFPMFHAVTLIHKEDWERIEGAIMREQERRSTLSV